MPRYWIVIARERDELFEPLQEAVKGHPAISVIRERRIGASDGGRRRAHVWQGQGVTVAEEPENGPAQYGQ